MDNLNIYNAARAVPADAQKRITGGRLNGMTDINPMWRIKKLTEIFGAAGVGWWYTIDRKEIIHDELTAQKAAFVDITLYYRDPATGEASHGIPGTGGSAFVAKESKGAYMSDECFKMALTDAISVAAKALGVGADIYWAGDRDKYSSNTEPTATPTQKPAKRTKAPAPHVCENCGKEIVGYTAKNGEYKTEDEAAALSKKKFGRVLCLDCMKAETEKAQNPATETKPEQNGDPHAALKFRCEECGDELHMRTENGIAVPIREDAYRSKAIYGKVLCPKCQAIHDAAQPAPWESPEPLKWEDGRANAR